MDRFQIEGQIAGVFVLFPFCRFLIIRWLRNAARRMVAPAGEETLRRWAGGRRVGRFTCAYLCGLAVSGLVFAVLWAVSSALKSPLPLTPPSLLAGLIAADMAAQVWSEREARIRALDGGHPASTSPGPALEIKIPDRTPTAAPVGLFTGLGILGAVFTAVLALATYHNQATTLEKEPAPPEAIAPPHPAALPMDAHPPTRDALPPVIGAATPAPAAMPGPTPMYRNVDFSEVIRQMNEEANALMPYALELPAPEDQYQQLASQFQKMAAKYFPDLASRDSPLNREFVLRYKILRENSPNFFDQPDWPVRLTIECVDLLAAGKSTQEPPATGQ